MNVLVTIPRPRNDPLCPICLEQIDFRNIKFAYDTAWCATCAENTQDHNQHLTAWILANIIDPRHNTNARGIILFTPTRKPPHPVQLLPAHGDQEWLRKDNREALSKYDDPTDPTGAYYTTHALSHSRLP